MTTTLATAVDGAASEQGDQPDPITAVGFARLFTVRNYLLRVRPGLLVVVLVLVALSDLARPSSVTAISWLTLAGFAAVQAISLVLTLRTSHQSTAVTLTFAGDVVLTSFGVLTAPEPIGASALMTLFVVAAAFFAKPRTTILVAALFAAEITIASQVDEGWGNSLAFPNTAFVVLSSGILGAALVTRMRRSEHALQEAIAEELVAREELERVGEVRDRLIANVSHELRTPLTATLSSVETLLRDDIELSASEESHLLQLAHDGGTRLLTLVEDLLTLGITPPRSVVASRPSIPVAPVVDAVVARIDAGPGRAVRSRLEPDVVARIEPGRLERVVDHLVTNAVRHGSGDVLVELQRQPDGDSVLTVSDHGAGVPEAHLHELFLPFSRFSSRADCTGLGLAISRSIVQSCGGTVTYAGSSPLTTFEVRLPAPGEGAHA